MEFFQKNQRHFMGEDLDSLSLKKLMNLEPQIDMALKRLRLRKNQLMLESISDLQKNFLRSSLESWSLVASNSVYMYHNCYNHTRKALPALMQLWCLKLKQYLHLRLQIAWLMVGKQSYQLSEGTYGHIRAEEYPDLPPDVVPPNDLDLWKRSTGGRRKGHIFGIRTQDPEYAMSGNSGAATSGSSYHDEEWDALREEVRQEKEVRLKMEEEAK